MRLNPENKKYIEYIIKIAIYDYLGILRNFKY